MEEDLYQVLGVPRDASPDEIKRAFRRLSHQHHPDKGGEAKKFQEINRAYQILSDPQKRSQYDQFGHVGGPNGPGGPGFDPRAGGFGGRGTSFDFGFGAQGFGDIFEDLFGAAFANVQAEVQISPAQAVLGAEIDLRVGEDKITLAIPPGTQNGQAFNFRGKGKSYGRGRGDLQIVVKIVMPTGRRMSRRERELWEELKKLSS